MAEASASVAVYVKDFPEVKAMADELANLRRWKAEAMEVLCDWERVFEAAGRPGPLGGSKAQAVHDLIVRHGIRDNG